MANIFWEGDKSPEGETVKALRKKTVDIWDGPFHVRFRNGHLELVIEHSSDESSGLWSEFDGPKFMGHEFHILKVPEGYTKFLKEKES